MDRERIREISEKSKKDRWPFPQTFAALKAAGVLSYVFDVASSETEFRGASGAIFSEALPGSKPVEISPALDAAAVAAAIRRHAKERTPFAEFRADAAKAGVERWRIDMEHRTCTYLGRDGGRHVEEIP